MKALIGLSGLLALCFFVLMGMGLLLVDESVAEAKAEVSPYCATIVDPDTRNYCRARSSGDVSACSSISWSDMRNFCRAVIKRDASICPTIQDAGLKALCRMETD